MPKKQILTGSPCIALQLASYEQLKRFFAKSGNPQISTFAEKMTFGSVSGILSQSATYWGDTVKRRMQSDGINGEKKLYRNTLDCIKRILATEGTMGFHRGFMVNVLRSVPGTAIQLTAYDLLKNMCGSLK